MRKRLAALCLLSCALFAACGVSVPNLETPVCAESGDALKRFYSYHLDAGAALTPEAVRERERYLTPEFAEQAKRAGSETDPFTRSAEIPRGFRLGECRSASPDEAAFKVFLFWSDGQNKRQSSVSAQIVKRNDNWLINKISEE